MAGEMSAAFEASKRYFTTYFLKEKARKWGFALQGGKKSIVRETSAILRETGHREIAEIYNNGRASEREKGDKLHVLWNEQGISGTPNERGYVLLLRVGIFKGLNLRQNWGENEN